MRPVHYHRRVWRWPLVLSNHLESHRYTYLTSFSLLVCSIFFPVQLLVSALYLNSISSWLVLPCVIIIFFFSFYIYAFLSFLAILCRPLTVLPVWRCRYSVTFHYLDLLPDVSITSSLLKSQLFKFCRDLLCLTPFLVLTISSTRYWSISLLPFSVHLFSNFCTSYPLVFFPLQLNRINIAKVTVTWELCARDNIIFLPWVSGIHADFLPSCLLHSSGSCGEDRERAVCFVKNTER